MPSAYTLAGHKATSAGAVHVTLVPTAFGAAELEAGEFEVREGRGQIKE
jgi:hypothetical protein